MDEFNKRYYKLKNNNLPTPFWDEERRILEYVYFDNSKSTLNLDDKIEVNTNLVDALGEVANISFYYSFTSKYPKLIIDNEKTTKELVIGKIHVHSFEQVVKTLYDFPESFSISKEEEQLYSKQELEYLKRVQKYLLFIGIKDLNIEESQNSRYINIKRNKYEKAYIYKRDNETIKNIINKNINFDVKKCYSEYLQDKKFEPNEYQALLVDEEENFKIFIEITERKTMHYKDIKKLYNLKNLKDDDKVVVTYFKILEIFA